MMILSESLVRVVHADRMREIDAIARMRALAAARTRRPSFRRRLGDALVRLGARIAADSTAEPARASTVR